MDATIGKNINGPSLIKVPDWIKKPLGKYYLYFAHHQGTFIRLAFSDDLLSRWQIYAPGTLSLARTNCRGHIASPDLHIDHERRELIMYFHGGTPDGQRSFVAVSKDGLNFSASHEVLGPFYFRVFTHEGIYYAIAKTVDAMGGGVLLMSPDGRSPFEKGPDILPRQRHAALLKRGDQLHVFYSRGLDRPERILVSGTKLAGDWRSWSFSEPADVLIPEEQYEGASLPLARSKFGAIHHPVRQLRDPAIFEENGKTYLLYSCAGESALAMAELDYGHLENPPPYFENSRDLSIQ